MLFFGVMKQLPFRSSVRSQVRTTARKDLKVHRYVIACEFYRANRAAGVADTIRRLASQWEHPLQGLWIVETDLSADGIRSELLAHLDFQDRVYICAAGGDTLEINAMPASGAKVTQIGQARAKSRMLAGIFSRNANSSRHLKAATARNLKSA